VIRDLVTNLPIFWLGVVLIALFVVPGLVGVRVVRMRRRGDVPTDEVTGVALTVMAAVYGVMLAFAVIVLYQQFSDARDDVHAETGALVTMYRSSQELGEPIADDMKEQVRAYVAAVTGPEWEAMADGHDSPLAWARIHDMYRLLGDYRPQTPGERAFFERAVVALGSLVETRRVRISDARSTLPGPFLVLLIGGGFALMLFTLFFGVENRRYHDLVIVSIGALIGFSLMLCLSLEYPFSGGIAVSKEPYEEGSLSEL
jgi:uncharacterized protein DUF4239